MILSGACFLFLAAEQGTRGWLATLTDTGRILSESVADALVGSSINAVGSLPDGGMVSVGTVSAEGGGGLDLWVVRGDAWGATDCSAAGACAGLLPLDCDDENVCTDDGCDAVVGCTHVPHQDPCEAGDPCGAVGLCDGGICATVGPALWTLEPDVIPGTTASAAARMPSGAGYVIATTPGVDPYFGFHLTAVDRAGAALWSTHVSKVGDNNGHTVAGLKPLSDGFAALVTWPGGVYLAYVDSDGGLRWTADVAGLAPPSGLLRLATLPGREVIVVADLTEAEDGFLVQVYAKDGDLVASWVTPHRVRGLIGVDDDLLLFGSVELPGVAGPWTGWIQRTTTTGVSVWEQTSPADVCSGWSLASTYAEDGAVTLAGSAMAFGTVGGDFALAVLVDLTPDGEWIDHLAVAGLSIQDLAALPDGELLARGNFSPSYTNPGPWLQNMLLGLGADRSVHVVRELAGGPLSGVEPGFAGLALGMASPKAVFTMDRFGTRSTDPELPCCGTTLAACDDQDPCTWTTCDAGGCGAEVMESLYLPCDPGDACVLAAYCDGGACEPMSDVECDDANPCTDDACDAVGGCTNTPNETNPCNDGDECTFSACTADGVCDSPVAPDGYPCSVGTCEAGLCTP